MEYRKLEVNVISAKDLSDVNLFSKMDVYAVVSISGDHQSKQKTPVDRNGGKDPTWNFPAKFTVDLSAAQQNNVTLVVQLRCERSLGDKDIGEVHVPVKELLETVDKPIQFVSYQVRKPSGKAKGVLNISYKFGEKFAGAPAPVITPVYPAPATVPAVGTSCASAYQPNPYGPPGNAMYPPPHGYPPPQPVAEYGYQQQQQPPQPVAGYVYPPQQPPQQPMAEYGYPPQKPPKPVTEYEYPPQQQPSKPVVEYGYTSQQPPKPVAEYGYPPQQPPKPVAEYGYPPQQPQYPTAEYGYPPPPQQPQQYGGYPSAPPHPGYGYPPQPGYGYPPPPQQGYGYPPVQQPAAAKKKKNNNFGMGLGAGLLGGAIGGMLIGDMVSDGGFDDGGF